MIFAVTAALTTVIVLATSGAGAAANAGPLVGTWRGTMAARDGSHAVRHRLTIVVDRGERAGTWTVGPQCRGTLRLKDLSYGFHHYTEIAAPHTRCAGGGEDCLKRVGAQMLDVFVSAPGTAADSTGRLRRLR